MTKEKKRERNRMKEKEKERNRIREKGKEINSGQAKEGRKRWQKDLREKVINRTRK